MVQGRNVDYDYKKDSISITYSGKIMIRPTRKIPFRFFIHVVTNKDFMITTTRQIPFRFF